MKETVIIRGKDTLTVMLPEGADADLCTSLIFAAFDTQLNMDPDSAVFVCLDDLVGQLEASEAVSKFKDSLVIMKEHIQNNCIDTE